MSEPSPCDGWIIDLAFQPYNFYGGMKAVPLLHQAIASNGERCGMHCSSFRMHCICQEVGSGAGEFLWAFQVEE